MKFLACVLSYFKQYQECQSTLVHSEADLKEQSVSHSMDTWRMVVAALTLRLGNEKVKPVKSSCPAGIETGRCGPVILRLRDEYVD